MALRFWRLRLRAGRRAGSCSSPRCWAAARSTTTRCWLRYTTWPAGGRSPMTTALPPPSAVAACKTSSGTRPGRASCTQARSRTTCRCSTADKGRSRPGVAAQATPAPTVRSCGRPPAGKGRPPPGEERSLSSSTGDRRSQATPAKSNWGRRPPTGGSRPEIQPAVSLKEKMRSLLMHGARANITEAIGQRPLCGYGTKWRRT